MKPGRILRAHRQLADRARRTPRPASKLSGEVFRPGDISTSFISCAGRQKCMPTKRSARPEPPAISVIDRVEVFDANKRRRARTIASSRRKSSHASPRDSRRHGFDDQVAIGQVLKSGRALPGSPGSAGTRSAASLPRSTDRRRNASVWARACAIASSRVSTTRVRRPARAQTIAMPAPMVPQPAMPTVATGLGAGVGPAPMPAPVVLNRASCSLVRRRKAAPDQLPVHLVRSFPDLGDLRIAHQPLDPVVAHVAVARRSSWTASVLARIARSLARSFRIEASMPKSVAPASTRAPIVHSHDSTSARLGREVGDHELDRLELEDAAAGLAPLVDVVDRILERGPRDAERMRGDARPRLVQRGEQDLQPGARRAEQVVARYAAAVEGERRGARRARAHLVLEPHEPTGPACPSPGSARRSRPCRPACGRRCRRPTCRTRAGGRPRRRW